MGLSDILKIQGVMAKGYGMVPKLVMQDTRLSRDAKAIYAYMCSYAGAGNTAFPSTKKICIDLGFGKLETMVRHRRQLEKYGYIKVEQERAAGGKFARNIYTLIQFPEEEPKTLGISEKLPTHHLGDSVKKQEIADPPFGGLGEKATPSKRDSKINRSFKININNKNTTTTTETNLSKKEISQKKQEAKNVVVVDKHIEADTVKKIQTESKAGGISLTKKNVVELIAVAQGDIEQVRNGVMAAVEYAQRTEVRDMWGLVLNAVKSGKMPAVKAPTPKQSDYSNKYKFFYMS